MIEKRMQELFITQDQEDLHERLCCCGTNRHMTGTGYTNLVYHLCEKHSNEYSAELGGAGTQSGSRDLDASHKARNDAFLWNP